MLIVCCDRLLLARLTNFVKLNFMVLVCCARGQLSPFAPLLVTPLLKRAVWNYSLHLTCTLCTLLTVKIREFRDISVTITR